VSRSSRSSRENCVLFAGTFPAPAEETECTRVTRDSQSMHARGVETKWPVLSGKIASAMFSSPPFLPGTLVRVSHPPSKIPRRRSRRRELVYSRVLNCLPRTGRYLMMLTFKCDGRALPREIFWAWRRTGWGSRCGDQCRITTLIMLCWCDFCGSIELLSKNYTVRYYIIILIIRVAVLWKISITCLTWKEKRKKDVKKRIFAQKW